MSTRLAAGRYLGQALASPVTAPGLRAVASRYPAGARLSEHEHEHAHLCAVLQGHYEERVGGRTHERRALDVVWYPAGIGHAERHGPNGLHLIVDVDAAAPLAAELPRDVVELGAPALGWSAARLERALRDPDADDELDRRALLLELAAAPLRERTPALREPSWMGRVERHLERHARSGVGLAELARVAGVDEAHLARSWRRFRGETIGEHRRRLQVRYAARRLGAERTPVAEVALAAGFADQSHLGRVFRRLVGTTPGRFRRALR